MKLFPPKHVQIILHQGAKIKKQPKVKPLSDTYEFLDWKANDRAVITKNTMEDYYDKAETLKKIIKDWISFTQLQINA